MCKFIKTIFGRKNPPSRMDLLLKQREDLCKMRENINVLERNRQKLILYKAKTTQEEDGAEVGKFIKELDETIEGLKALYEAHWERNSCLIEIEKTCTEAKDFLTETNNIHQRIDETIKKIKENTLSLAQKE